MSNSTRVGREPLIRISKKDVAPWWQKAVVRVIALIAALIIDAIFIYLFTKMNPLDVFSTMFKGTFVFDYGTTFFINKLLRTLRDMATLLCIAIALAPAFKMKFWNIGAEGQVLMGGLATACVMQYFGDSLPTPALFMLMLTASIVAGAVWGFLPAFFNAKWKTNETLFTLMMNYIAIDAVACMTNIWRGDKSAMGTINQATQAGWFPNIFNQRFTLNLFIVAALMIIVFVYLRYSKQGYEISVVGESENTAKYAGINVKKVVIRTMIISGAICGICGFMTVAGKDQAISTATAGGYGFTAIIVAWMAKFNTFYMALISFLIVFLEHGASEIANTYGGLNDYAASVITAVILFCLIGSEFFLNYNIKLRKGSKKEA